MTGGGVFGLELVFAPVLLLADGDEAGGELVVVFPFSLLQPASMAKDIAMQRIIHIIRFVFFIL